MYKIISATALALVILAGCTSLTFQEQQELADLQYRGITVDRAPGGWQPPAKPLNAGLLNFLPGGGNMYLASGNASDSSHWTFALLNLLTWPFSIIWGVPEAAIDANTINKRDMLNFYKYGNQGNINIRRMNRLPGGQNMRGNERSGRQPEYGYGSQGGYPSQYPAYGY